MGLFSNITGAICTIDKDVDEILEHFNTPLYANEVYREDQKIKIAIEQLFSGGYVVPKDQDEIQEFRRKVEGVKNKKAHGFMFIMTLKCNFRCVYCYEPHDEIDMSKETADKCIDFLLQKITESQQKIVPIMFYGGEPLLQFPLIKYILERISEKLPKDVKISSSIITNGSLLTSENAKLFKDYNCSTIQITVDGTQETHNRMRPYASSKGSFDDIVRGLKVALEYFPVVSLRVNVDQANLNSVPELLNWLKDNNFQRPNLIINFGQIRATTEQSGKRGTFCISDYSWGKEFLRLTNIARDMGFKAHFGLPRLLFCGAYSKGSVVFDPEGNLVTCWEGIGDKRFIIGNVNSNPVYNQNAETFWKRNPLDFEKCKNCDIIGFCGGGCISSALSENGAMDSVSCPYYKQNFRELVELYTQQRIEDKMYRGVDFGGEK